MIERVDLKNIEKLYSLKDNELKLALYGFNITPPFTYFSLADADFCNLFAEVLVSYEYTPSDVWYQRVGLIKNHEDFKEWLPDK